LWGLDLWHGNFFQPFISLVEINLWLRKTRLSDNVYYYNSTRPSLTTQSPKTYLRANKLIYLESLYLFCPDPAKVSWLNQSFSRRIKYQT